MRRTVCLMVLLLLVLVGCERSGTSSSASTTGTTNGNDSKTAGGPGNGVSSVPGLQLPTGFQLNMYATGLNHPRFMTIGPKGILLVANRGDGTIVALPPGNNADKAGNPMVVASGLDDPTSLEIYKGNLYVGEATSIARMSLDDNLKTGPITRIITNLPQGGHSTRTVLIGPDEHLYVSIGSSCNVCDETDPHRAAVWIYNLDGSQGRLFTKGLRNAVGLAVNPWTEKIWATNNGRDMLGDDIPPETVNELVDGGDFGWPRCHAGTIVDPDFGGAAGCQGVKQPLIKMQAHSAPLGLAFYPRDARQFPSQYRNSLYVAFHGSWNRSTPTGYKVIRIPLQDGKIAGPAQDFIKGWLDSNNQVSGRPVGITFAPDGSLFVSDDQQGRIYHVTAHA